MKFETLQELIDYVPQCIICHKNMELRINGIINLSTVYSIDDPISFRMVLTPDGQLSSKNKNHSLVVNPKTNELSSGLDVLNRMTSKVYRDINVYKKCRTCSCSIICEYSHVNHYNTTNKHLLPKLERFPELTLRREELSYTMNKSRIVRIVKYFQPNDSLAGVLGHITVNHKPVHSFPLDFSKMRNLKQLNNKIKTMMVFQ